MTDNEIIKALECCSQEDKCPNCPYVRVGGCISEDNINILLKDVLNLINRQKAEIERLKTAYETLKQEYDSMFSANRNLMAEVERLQKLQKPTGAGGFKIENGKVIFYSDMLNGYRHEFRDLDEIVKELNLYMQTDYKNIELISHYKHKAQNAKSEAIKEFEKKSENILIGLYEEYHKIANKPKEETDMFFQGRAEAIWECINTNRNVAKELTEKNDKERKYER